MKKLFAYMMGILGLFFYILLVSRLIDVWFPKHIALEMLYYALAGIGWIFPVMFILRRLYNRKNKLIRENTSKEINE